MKYYDMKLWGYKIIPPVYEIYSLSRKKWITSLIMKKYRLYNYPDYIHRQSLYHAMFTYGTVQFTLLASVDW